MSRDAEPGGMLATWKRYAEPGEEHQLLQRLAGKWNVRQRFRADPGQPFQEVTAEAENRWVLGQRFMQLTLRGRAHGAGAAQAGAEETFECLGYLGYDVLERNYSFVWLETATTAMEIRHGAAAKDASTLVLSGEHRDPVTREIKSTKLVYRFGAPGTFRLEIAERQPDGGEFVYFEADYQRADAGAALLDGKVCLLTGGNRGIGRAVAAQLAALGAELILLVRAEQSGEKARLDLQRRTGRQVRLLVCDLASQVSIRAAAQKLYAMVDRLDILVNNAATIPRRRQLTVDGVETQLAVNHLGGFLLTNLVLPLLKAAPAARVINVASNAHAQGRLDFDDLQATKRYQKQARYKATKLANVAITYAFARRLEGTRVTVNAVRPGTINTGLIADFLWPVGFLRWLFAYSPPSRGAAPIVRVASDPALDGVSGRYFDRFRERPSSAVSRDQALQERLWEASIALTGLERGRG